MKRRRDDLVPSIATMIDLVCTRSRQPSRGGPSVGFAAWRLILLMGLERDGNGYLEALFFLIFLFMSLLNLLFNAVSSIKPNTYIPRDHRSFAADDLGDRQTRLASYFVLFKNPRASSAKPHRSSRRIRSAQPPASKLTKFSVQACYARSNCMEYSPSMVVLTIMNVFKCPASSSLRVSHSEPSTGDFT